jgi:hypothetical protein
MEKPHLPYKTLFSSTIDSLVPRGKFRCPSLDVQVAKYIFDTEKAAQKSCKISTEHRKKNTSAYSTKNIAKEILRPVSRNWSS